MPDNKITFKLILLLMPLTIMVFIVFNIRYEEMERPCFPGNSHRNPRNNFSWVMTDHLRDQDVLGIHGNETLVRNYFSHTHTKIGRLSQVKIGSFLL